MTVVARYGPEVSESGEDAVLRGVQCLADYYDTEDAESSASPGSSRKRASGFAAMKSPAASNALKTSVICMASCERTYRRTVFLQGVGDVFQWTIFRSPRVANPAM